VTAVSGFRRAGLAALCMAGLLALSAAGFVWSGIYDIGADDHHTRLVRQLLERLRDRSIAVRARAVVVALPEDPQSIVEGANRYARLCATCHLAPGMPKSDVRAGLYPHPPSLEQQAPADPRRTFWIIKHGIKMSAMPAWGRTLSDRDIWQLVAFVRTLPGLTAESYRRLLWAPNCAPSPSIGRLAQPAGNTAGWVREFTGETVPPSEPVPRPSRQSCRAMPGWRDRLRSR